MKTMYELMDTEDGNLIGTYPTQKAALHVVRYSVNSFGPASMKYVVLRGENEVGSLVTVAQGDELIQLACEGRKTGTLAGLMSRCRQTVSMDWGKLVRAGHIKRRHSA